MKNIKETEEYIVVEFANDSGRKYEVGYPKKAGYTKDSIDAEITAANQNRSAPNAAYAAIRWSVDGESSTSKGAKKIGIESGYITKSSGAAVYIYRMNFTNSKGWVFTFKDESGDSYDCYTFQNGTHYIDYNSSDPTVIGVK
jgi:hypothetical protein